MGQMLSFPLVVAALLVQARANTSQKLSHSFPSSPLFPLFSSSSHSLFRSPLAREYCLSQQSSHSPWLRFQDHDDFAMYDPMHEKQAAKCNINQPGSRCSIPSPSLD
mmetsp:Transcript_43935/g.88060  ORF Transcript_43935/g.88060 Transcript_43935/m.88060 type:complete len:107 (-) Transcript_43935:227-547(-)